MTGCPVDYVQVAELQKLGYSVSQIATRLGCSTKAVERWRRSEGLTILRANASRPVTPERLEAARRMIEDGASHRDVSLTLRMSRKTLRRHFPDTAWTPEQAGHAARMVQRLNRIETRAYMQQKSGDRA